MKEFLQGSISAAVVTALLLVGLLAMKPEVYGRWLAKVDMSYEVVMDSYYNP